MKQIAVLGSWDTDLEKTVYETAEQVGRLIAGRGDVVFTGGATGVMEAAMKGAKSAGGTTVGMLPTESAKEYDLLGGYIDIFIQTGMGEMGKLAPLIHSTDGAIAIAGGSGTLIEISMAYIQQKPIVGDRPRRQRDEQQERRHERHHHHQHPQVQGTGLPDRDHPVCRVYHRPDRAVHDRQQARSPGVQHH